MNVLASQLTKTVKDFLQHIKVDTCGVCFFAGKPIDGVLTLAINHPRQLVSSQTALLEIFRQCPAHNTHRKDSITHGRGDNYVHT